MNDKETATHILHFLEEKPHDIFAWPTDGCGYDQHIKFVNYRNKYWTGCTEKGWIKFTKDYAEKLIKREL